MTRVLRGGSWNKNPQNLRAATRFDRAHPDNRNNNIGFRVCRGSHIVIALHAHDPVLTTVGPARCSVIDGAGAVPSARGQIA